MGVDTRIYLPTTCSVRNVGNVMGAYMGLPVKKQSFRDNTGYYVIVDGVQINGVPDISCIAIDLKGKLVDGEEHHHLLFHFETEYQDTPMFLLCPRSTPLWIAIGKKLINFFGGHMVYQDCGDWDDLENIYSQPCKSLRYNRPSDGDAWTAFQDKILSIVPLTQDDLNECKKYAAYLNR